MAKKESTGGPYMVDVRNAAHYRELITHYQDQAREKIHGSPYLGKTVQIMVKQASTIFIGDLSSCSDVEKAWKSIDKAVIARLTEEGTDKDFDPNEVRRHVAYTLFGGIPGDGFVGHSYYCHKPPHKHRKR